MKRPQFDWWHGPAWAACIIFALILGVLVVRDLQDHEWLRAGIGFVGSWVWWSFADSAAARYDPHIPATAATALGAAAVNRILDVLSYVPIIVGGAFFVGYVGWAVAAHVS